MNSCAKNGAAPRRRFSAICEKPEGVFKHPPARRGLRYASHVLVIEFWGNHSLSVPQFFESRQLHICQVLIRAPLGSAIRAPLVVGDSAPLPYFRTVDRRKTRETAFENSQQFRPFEYKIVCSSRSQVRSRSCQVKGQNFNF